MSDAHRRPKLPDQTKQSLLDAAVSLALTKGFGALTISNVITQVGVTKGALFHHFTSKQGLIDALYAEVLRLIDAELDAAFANEEPGYGQFTRAYIRCTFHPAKTQSPWSSLSVAAIGDQDLARIWREWLARRLTRHADTDADPRLAVPRLAADGWWAAHHFQKDQHPTPETTALMQTLISLTKAPS